MVNSGLLGFGLSPLEIIQILSFVGILFSIFIATDSLVQQKRAAVRESIEQLDDMELPAIHSKIRPFLHRFRYSYRRGSTVKIKIYQHTDVAGVSKNHPQFIVFSGYLFEAHSVAITNDGYLLDIDSIDPVVVRRVTDDLLTKLSNVGRSRSSGEVGRANYDLVKSYYPDFLREKIPEFHKDIIIYLGENRQSTLQKISTHMGTKWPGGEALTKIALADLQKYGCVSVINRDNQRDLYHLVGSNSGN